MKIAQIRNLINIIILIWLESWSNFLRLTETKRTYCSNFYVHDLEETYLKEMNKIINDKDDRSISNEVGTKSHLVCFLFFYQRERTNFYAGYDENHRLVCSRAKISTNTVHFFRQGNQ